MTTLLELYDYIGDRITGKKGGMIDWDKEYIEVQKVKDIITKYFSENYSEDDAIPLLKDLFGD